MGTSIGCGIGWISQIRAWRSSAVERTREGEKRRGQGHKGGEEGKRERGERKRGKRETEKEMSHTVV